MGCDSSIVQDKYPCHSEVSSQSRKGAQRYALTPAEWASLTIQPVTERTFRAEHVTEGKIAVEEGRSTPVFLPASGLAWKDTVNEARGGIVRFLVRQDMPRSARLSLPYPRTRVARDDWHAKSELTEEHICDRAELMRLVAVAREATTSMPRLARGENTCCIESAILAEKHPFRLLAGPLAVVPAAGAAHRSSVISIRELRLYGYLDPMRERNTFGFVRAFHQPVSLDDIVGRANAHSLFSLAPICNAAWSKAESSQAFVDVSSLRRHEQVTGVVSDC